MKNIENAMRFYLLATDLKYQIRAHCDERHWKISEENRERTAAHVYGACIIANCLVDEFDLDIDRDKVTYMLLYHELGETIIKDISPFDGVSPEKKKELEHEAWKEMLGESYEDNWIYKLFIEFDEHETNEAKFAFLCDKIEADIQAKVYQDKGQQHDLNDQENNIVLRSNKILKIIENGARTVFDVWYESDKSLYENDPVFKEVLEYVRCNSMDITPEKDRIKAKIGISNK